MDGFNWNGGLLLPSRYESANAVFAWSSTDLKYVLRCNNNKHVTYNLGDQTDEVLIIGFKLNIIDTRFTTGDQPLLLIQDSGGATQVSLDITEYPCYLKIAGVSSPTALYINNWHHIELRIAVVNSTAADECVVKVDGIEVINEIGKDTQAQSTSNIEKVSFSMDSELAVLVDDFYVLDTNGSYANDFIGTRARIEALRPNGNRLFNDFVGSDADSTDNYLHVVEPAADDDVSYVESSTVGDKDSYNFDSIAGKVEEVLAIQTMSRHKKDKSGARTIKHFVVVDTDIDVEGQVEHILSNTYKNDIEIWVEHPYIYQWVEANINNMGAGVKVQA